MLANHNATHKHTAGTNIGTFTNEKDKSFCVIRSHAFMLVYSIPSPSFPPRFVYVPFMQPFGNSFCRALPRFRWGSVGLGWWALVVDACLEWRSTWKSSSQVWGSRMLQPGVYLQNFCFRNASPLRVEVLATVWYFGHCIAIVYRTFGNTFLIFLVLIFSW